MTKLAILATMFMLFVLLMVPQRNRAAGIDGYSKAAGGVDPPSLPLTAPAPARVRFRAPAALALIRLGRSRGFCVLAGSGNVAHGFVRAPDGTISLFDAPGAGTGKNQGTFFFSINRGRIHNGHVLGRQERLSRLRADPHRHN